MSGELKKAGALIAVVIGLFFVIIPLIAYYSTPIWLRDDGFGVGFFGFIGLCLIGAGFIDYFQADKKNKKEIVKKRFCPNCGREIPFDANICPYCKKDFEC